MLMPALSQARERGRMANCINTLKTIANGVQAYADASADYKPCVCWNKDTGSVRGYHYKQLGGEHADEGARHRGNTFLPSSNGTKFWQCPSVTAAIQRNVTYGMNAHHGTYIHLKMDQICRTGDDPAKADITGKHIQQYFQEPAHQQFKKIPQFSKQIVPCGGTHS